MAEEVDTSTIRQDIRIPAYGETIAAYLYRPESDGPVPCIVMAHGFTLTRDDGLGPYAEAFQRAGFAAIVFDYRRFGASTGEPRQVIDYKWEIADYHAVVKWARKLDGIDPDRIALWGTSFAGGMVVEAAATDPRIAAVVSQCPFADAIAATLAMPPTNVVRGSADAMLDRARALVGGKPRYMPAVAAPGNYAMMSAPEAKPGFDSMVDPKGLWRNEVAARILLQLSAGQGGAPLRPFKTAKKLTMPVLFCVCDADETTPPAPSIKASQLAPRGELRRYPYGHFDIYRDPQAKADQVEFLSRVLAAG